MHFDESRPQSDSSFVPREIGFQNGTGVKAPCETKSTRKKVHRETNLLESLTELTEDIRVYVTAL